MNKEQMTFSHDGAYPPIEISCRNPAYAREMLDNLGGSNSEMSAVSLYLYNNLITDEKLRDISYIFHKISIVEMHHLEIFGKLAYCLGEDPRLWTCCNNRRMYWSPSYNKYPVELARLMHNALNGELAAIEKYRRQSECIDNENIVANLCRIIEDEEVHVKIFRQIIEEYRL